MFPIPYKKICKTAFRRVYFLFLMVFFFSLFYHLRRSSTRAFRNIILWILDRIALCFSLFFPIFFFYLLPCSPENHSDIANVTRLSSRCFMTRVFRAQHKQNSVADSAERCKVRRKCTREPSLYPRPSMYYNIQGNPPRFTRDDISRTNRELIEHCDFLFFFKGLTHLKIFTTQIGLVNRKKILLKKIKN